MKKKLFMLVSSIVLVGSYQAISAERALTSTQRTFETRQGASRVRPTTAGRTASITAVGATGLRGTRGLGRRTAGRRLSMRAGGHTERRGQARFAAGRSQQRSNRNVVSTRNK